MTVSLLNVIYISIDAQSVYYLDYDDVVDKPDSIYFHEINVETCDTIQSIFYNHSSLYNFAVHPLSRDIYIYSEFISEDNNNLYYLFRFNVSEDTVDTLYESTFEFGDPWTFEFICPNKLLISEAHPFHSKFRLFDLETNSLTEIGEFDYLKRITNCSGRLIEYMTLSNTLHELDKQSLERTDFLGALDNDINFLNLDCYSTCDQDFFAVIDPYVANGGGIAILNGEGEVVNDCPLTASTRSYWPHIMDLPYYEILLDLDTTTSYCSDNNAIITYDCNESHYEAWGLHVDYFNNYHELDSMVIWIEEVDEDRSIRLTSHKGLLMDQVDADELRLYNTGSSTDEDFSEALRSLVYEDGSALPHFDTYEVKVQIYECGAESVPASLFFIPESISTAGDDIRIGLCADYTEALNLGDYLSGEADTSGYWLHGSSTLEGTTDLSGTYNYVVDNGDCGQDTSRVDIFYYDAAEKLCEERWLCSGDSLEWGNEWLKMGGIYRDTVLSEITGCDSLVTELELYYVPDAYTAMEDYSICYGDTLDIHGRMIYRDTMFLDTLLYDSVSCDSVYLEYRIEVTEEAVEVNQDTLICPGQMIEWRSQNITSAGSYSDKLISSESCDSINYILRVSVEAAAVSDVVLNNYCYGDTVIISGITVYSDTIISDTLAYVGSGCDSLIREYDVEFSQPLTQDYDEMHLCHDELIEWHGMMLDEGGEYSIVYVDSDNCDSLELNLSLSYYPAPGYEEIYEELCDGEVFQYRGHEIDRDSSWVDTLRYEESECDSMYIGYALEWSESVITEAEAAMICKEAGIYWRGMYIEDEGVYTEVISDAQGCDSLVMQMEVSEWDETQMLSPEIFEVEKGVLEEIVLLFDRDVRSIEWYPATGLDCSRCTEVNVMLEQDEDYTLLVEDENGCETEHRLEVRVQEDDVSTSYYLPNIIRVNGIGNNRLYLQTSDETIIRYDIKVYDRWGNEIYVYEDAQSNDASAGWDGRYQGDWVVSGVYVVMIEMKGSSRDMIVEDITVVR